MQSIYTGHDTYFDATKVAHGCILDCWNNAECVKQGQSFAEAAQLYLDDMIDSVQVIDCSTFECYATLELNDTEELLFFIKCYAKENFIYPEMETGDFKRKVGDLLKIYLDGLLIEVLA